MSAEIIEAASIAGYLGSKGFWATAGFIGTTFGGMWKYFDSKHEHTEDKVAKLGERLTAHEIDAASKIGAMQERLDDIPHIRKRIDEVADHLINKQN